MGKAKRPSKPWSIYWRARLLDLNRRLGRGLDILVRGESRPHIIRLYRTRNEGRRKYGLKSRANRGKVV